MQAKHTSEQWLELLFGDRLKIIKPMGWSDNHYYSFYKEEIPMKDFLVKLNNSETLGKKDFLNRLLEENT